MKSLTKYARNVLLANPQYIDFRPLGPLLRTDLLKTMADYTGYNKVYALPQNQFLGLLHLKYNLSETSCNLNIRFMTMAVIDNILIKQYHKVPDNVFYDFGISINKGEFKSKHKDMYVVVNNDAHAHPKIMFKPVSIGVTIYVNATPRATQLIRELKEFSGAKHPLATLITTSKSLIEDCPPRNTLVDLCIIALSRAPRHISLMMPENLIYKMQYALAYRHINPSKPLVFIELSKLLTILTVEHPHHVLIGGGPFSANIYIRSGKDICEQNTRLADTLQVFKYKEYPDDTQIKSKDLPLDCALALQRISEDKSRIVANVTDSSIECIYSADRPINSSPPAFINMRYLVGIEPTKFILQLQKKYASVGTLSVFSRIIDFPTKYLGKCSSNY